MSFIAHFIAAVLMVLTLHPVHVVSGYVPYIECPDCGALCRVDYWDWTHDCCGDCSIDYWALEAIE